MKKLLNITREEILYKKKKLIKVELINLTV